MIRVPLVMLVLGVVACRAGSDRRQVQNANGEVVTARPDTAKKLHAVVGPTNLWKRELAAPAQADPQP